MLRTTLRNNLDMIPTIIIACCVLHNVGKHLNDNFDKSDEVDEAIDDPDDQPLTPTTPQSIVAIRAAGQQKRGSIARIV